MKLSHIGINQKLLSLNLLKKFSHLKFKLVCDLLCHGSEITD